MIYLEFLILYISLTGLFYLVYKVLKPSKLFIPLITFSGIIIILFIFGLINQLKIGAYIIYGIGLLSFIYYFFIKRKEIDKEIIRIILVFLVISIFVFIFLENIQFIHYDDFFNWGNIAKLIYEKNTLLSNEFNIPVETSNYIPGMSLLIYFFSKAIGFSEANCIIVKNIFAVVTILPLFSFVKKENKLSIIASVIVSLISLFGIIIFDYRTLLVDIIQATLGVSIFIFIYLNKENINKRSAICFIILVIVLYMIKVSGIIYLLFNLAFALIFNIIKFKDRKNIKKIIIIIVTLISILLILTIFWKIYSSRNIGNISKFNLNIEQWKTNYNLKTEEYNNENYGEINQNNYTFLKFFVINYTSKVFDIRFSCFTFVIAIEIIILVLLYFDKIDRKNAIKFEITIIVMYLLYSICYFIIYLFMMNYYEDKILSGIERYYGQLLVYFIGIIYILKNIFLNNNIEKINIKKENTNNFIYIIILIFFQVCILQSLFDNFDYKLYFTDTEISKYAQKIRKIDGINNIEKQSKIVLIYDNVEDPYRYSVYIVNYLTESKIISYDERFAKNNWDKYYVINIKDNNLRKEKKGH